MIFYKRVPATKRDYIQLFLVSLIPINVWAILVFFNRIPTMALQMSAVEIVWVAAYVLAYALIESLLLFSLLFFISLILPQKFLKLNLVTSGTIFVLLASFAAAFIHLHKAWEIDLMDASLWATLWVVSGFVSLALSMNWVYRNEKVEGLIRHSVERLSTLSLVYLAFDLLGVFIILFRNLSS